MLGIKATDADLKVIERLQQIGWNRGDTLLYQQEYVLSPEHRNMFDGRKSIKPDIMLTDLNGNILVDFEKIFLRGDIWQYLMKTF